MKFILGLLILIPSLLCSCASENGTGVNPDKELAYCHSQIKKTLAQLDKGSGVDYSMMPRNISKGDSIWNLRETKPEEWCSGFWPGILWYDYESTSDPVVKKEAELFTDAVKPILSHPVFDHDLGFLMFCSVGNAYRLTHKPEYKRVLINAADSLGTLFNPTVGTLLSWPRNVAMLGGHNTIMDNMINLELMFWAAKNGGNPYLYDMAVKHAETTMSHQFRPDHTCYHVAVYDSISGEFIKGMTHQGYSDSSTWARGQAWAIYGYTMVYRETKDPKFLDFAQKVTDAYLGRLSDDYIPYWDFDDPAIPNAPRDASAAAIVASALLELQSYCEKEKSDEYKDMAKKMLASLSSPEYKSGSARPSFIDHSTGHKPNGTEIDASIIYADYYYIEALGRLKTLEHPQNSNLAYK